MRLSREEKKALKEKLEKKKQLKEERLQKKNKSIALDSTPCENDENVLLNDNVSVDNVDNITNEDKIDENIDLSQNAEEQNKNIDTHLENNNESLVDSSKVSQVEINEDKFNNDDAEVEKEVKKNKVGFFKKIKNALKKTKESISNKIDQIFGKGELNDEFFEDLEDILISSDLGVETSSDIIENMRVKIKKDKLKTAEEVKEALREVIAEMLDIESEPVSYPKVSIIVGVNGVGKTTTIGKLANYYKSLGKKVVVVAGDTFRAAASDQLTEWAKRVDVKIIKQTEGADSASVVFDGISFAKSKGFDVVLVDTAGRLHNKVNLMEELSKVNRVATKNWEDADFERLIVIDATTGQNAVNQVREFNEAVDLDGIILTKLDGSAKGGIVVSICNEFDIPVKFVGVGEQMDDLVPFDAKEFVEGII